MRGVRIRMSRRWYPGRDRSNRARANILAAWANPTITIRGIMAYTSSPMHKNGHQAARCSLVSPARPSLSTIRLPSICSRVGTKRSGMAQDQGNAIQFTRRCTLSPEVKSVDCQPKARSVTIILKNVPPRAPVENPSAPRESTINTGQNRILRKDRVSRCSNSPASVEN